MTGLIAGFMLAIGQAFGTAYGTLEMRQRGRQPRGHVPPVMAGMAGNPVERGHHRRLHHLEVRPVLRLPRGPLVDPGPVRHAGRRGARGSLDFVAAAPFGKRRLALEKLAAHVTVVGLSMVFLALADVGGGLGLRRRPSWATRSPRSRRSASRCGSASSASPPVPSPSRWHRSSAGRAAAGVAGVVLLGWPSWWATTRPTCRPLGHRQPLLVRLDLRSRPAGGQYDWPSLALVALVAVALAGRRASSSSPAGTWASRAGCPCPGCRALTLGLRGPVGRAFGDQLPAGAGLGPRHRGLRLHARPPSSRPSADDLLTEFPAFADIIRTIFPTCRLRLRGRVPATRSSSRSGLIVVGFSAATFVGALGLRREQRAARDAAHDPAGAIALGGRRRHRRRSSRWPSSTRRLRGRASASAPPSPAATWSPRWPGAGHSACTRRPWSASASPSAALLAYLAGGGAGGRRRHRSRSLSTCWRRRWACPTWFHSWH